MPLQFLFSRNESSWRIESRRSCRGMDFESDFEIQAMPKLASTHKECITVYDPHNGEDNKHRLTGKHETSSSEKFSWGVANRAASVRIPRGVKLANKGYLEDRRPSSNCDPYQVTRMIAESIYLRP